MSDEAVKKTEDEKEDKGKLTGQKLEDFLTKVKKRLKQGIEAYSDDRSAAAEDLRFLGGEQWDEEEKKRRKARQRPMLTLNMLPEKVDRVVGDMRQNRARVKIRPFSSDANIDVARIREGIIRSIEYNSNAPAIYDYAGGRMAECGFGTWRYLTRYCEDNPFVQEIYMSLIKNSFTVIIDPSAREPNKSDAKWAFIISKMSKDAFDTTYPKHKAIDVSMEVGEGSEDEHWYEKDLVIVCEYYEVELETKTKCLMSDGIVLDKKEAEEKIEKWKKEQEQGSLAPGGITSPILLPTAQGTPPNIGTMGIKPPGSGPAMASPGGPIPGPGTGTPPPLPVGGTGTQPQSPMGMPVPSAPVKSPTPEPKILDTKDTKVPKVLHYVVNAVEVLEGPKRVPGKYIPIVEATGKERDIEGKTSVRGIIRDAKDPMRLVNYWNTSAAELVALAPKAPWIGTAKQFEGYEEDYANANIDSFPFLKYNPDPKAQGAPQRNHAGDPPVAVFTQISIAERNLNTIVGVGADLREAAPDASQKALIQRQKPAELSTFVFVDNLAQAIAYGGKIMNEMIPEVYDTERDVNIKELDETETFLPINMSVEEALKLVESNPDRYRGMEAAKIRSVLLQKGKDHKFNDIGIGKYSVVVDLGPSYATQRQESADNFIKLAQTYPKLWDTHGDLIVENLDIAGANKFAARYRKVIPPRLLELKPGETPPPPPPIPPQMQLMMEKTNTEKIKQQKEQLKTRVEMIRLYKETKETDKELRNEILKVLKELHAPNHFADSIIKQPGAGGAEAPQMPMGAPGGQENGQ